MTGIRGWNSACFAPTLHFALITSHFALNFSLRSVTVVTMVGRIVADSPILCLNEGFCYHPAAAEPGPVERGVSTGPEDRNPAGKPPTFLRTSTQDAEPAACGNN